jgi:hypothetical protein
VLPEHTLRVGFQVLHQRQHHLGVKDEAVLAPEPEVAYVELRRLRTRFKGVAVVVDRYVRAGVEQRSLELQQPCDGYPAQRDVEEDR